MYTEAMKKIKLSKLKLKAGDFIVFSLTALIAVFLILRTANPHGDKVFVEANGIHYEYSLSQDGLYSVPGLLGATVFEIIDGQVHIIDSPCPNKTCIHQGFSDTLVCLPNNVMIWIDKGEVDAVSQ